MTAAERKPSQRFVRRRLHADKRSVNAAIDRALLKTKSACLQHVVESAHEQDVSKMADRVRMRARRLAAIDGAHRCSILNACDALVTVLYRRATPAGWLCAWCDASVAGVESPRAAGIGAIIQDGSGHTVARISKRIPRCKPFEAEVAALAAALEATLALVGTMARIRVYTDCPAIVSLWLRHSRDPRLNAVAAAARRLRRFEPRALPRRHNQAAHRLARNAVHQTAV